MSVAITVTNPPVDTPQLPTLWELGTDLQAETHWIARLSERLDTEDEEERALAVADLEGSLASFVALGAKEHGRRLSGGGGGAALE